MNFNAAQSADTELGFEVYIREGRGWVVQQWTVEHWQTWLRTSTPAEIAKQILGWAMLLPRMPERQAVLALAIEAARQHLRMTEVHSH